MDQMRIKVFSLVIGLFCLIGWSSCTDKAPINGNLDGQWQLMHIEDRSTGETIDCHRLYWAIQLWVIELKDRGDNKYGDYIGRFVYNEEENTVRVSDFRVRYDEDKLATENQLLQYGIPSTDAVLEVVKADGKNLILQSETSILYFRSF